MRTLVRYCLVGFAVLGLGCGSEVSNPDFADGGPDGSVTPDASWTDAAVLVDPAGSNHLYVVNAVDVPTSAAEATQLGLDIDGDGTNTVDNKLGEILATLAAQGGGQDPQSFIDARIADGTILQLINIKATSLTDAERVGFSLYVGQDADVPADPSDNFSGFEEFLIATDSPTDSLLAGNLVSGHMSGRDGSIPLLVSVSDQVAPVLLNLVGARVECDADGTGVMNGHLAGGITKEQVHDDILPALHESFGITVAADCTGTTCTPGSAGESLLNLFDENGDGNITLIELENSLILTNLLAPDMDLLDAEGFYNPNQDGELDTLSFGVGFTAVGAQFIPPPLP